jgi:hypothetical protein
VGFLAKTGHYTHDWVNESERRNRPDWGEQRRRSPVFQSPLKRGFHAPRRDPGANLMTEDLQAMHERVSLLKS